MENQEPISFDLHDDILLDVMIQLSISKLILRIQTLKWNKVPNSKPECYRPENSKIIEIRLNLKAKPEISCSFEMINQEILWCYLHGNLFELTLTQGNLACNIESFEVVESGTERNITEEFTKAVKKE